jgi:DNA-binding SARP family transcriptional activator
MTKGLHILSDKSVMFHLYGTVGASIDGVSVQRGTEKQHRMAVPLLRAKGRPVSHLELVEWMWDDPLPSAPDTIGDYVSEFRDCLAQLGLKGRLGNRDRVCRLAIPPDQVDAHRLTARVAEADRLDDRTAAARLREVLAQCAGQPLTGLPGRRIEAYRQALLEERRKAEMALIRVDFRLGRVANHVDDLVRLFRERPEDTDAVTLTMAALGRTGRHDEALAVYRRCRERLIELGMKVPQRMAELVPQLESHV